MIKYLDLFDPAIVLDKYGIEKIAEEKDNKVDKRIKDFIKTTKSNKDDSLLVHKVLLGDEEHWGNNKNGDSFPARWLFADNKKYGYKTLLRAGIYSLHKNKDKSRSMGDIVMSVVNPIMKRVELLERLDRKKSKEFDSGMKIYDRLLDGETLFSSMGTTVPYDICSCCGNKAPTRSSYCDHLLYRMNEIMPNGLQIRAINPEPNLFDDSYVNNPAFRPAFTLNIYLSDGKKLEKTAGKRVLEEKDYKGIPIAIEVKKDSYRFRKFYKTLMHCDYGYIKGTQGEDGEEVDVYMIDKDSDKVYRIKQLKKGTGDFDEYKYILGAKSSEEAKEMYLKHMPEYFFGGIKEIPFEAFKQIILEEEKTADDTKIGDMIKRIPATAINTDVLKKIKFK